MALIFKRLFFIFLISILPTILIWIVFFLRIKTFWKIPLPQNGMASIVANYDGPLYIAISKTFYNKEALKTFSFNLPSEYYTAHFPLFPTFVRILAPISGYPYSMLLTTMAFSILAMYFFYKLILENTIKKEVLWMVFIFSLFPARWLIVRSIGSPEPLFIASIIASLYYFKKQKYSKAGLWGALAALTKPPGILLFAAYLLSICQKLYKLAESSGSFKKSIILIKNTLPIILIPLSLIIVFIIFQIRTGDFFAYFHSGDNIHLFFPPFQIFNYSASWVGTFWLEEIIFVYLFGAMGLMKLIEKKEYEIAWFVGVFFTTTLFISHRDLIRYSLPIFPFILYSFSETLISKNFKIAFIILIIPIYLFSLAFISNNIMPVSNWAPLL